MLTLAYQTPLITQPVPIFLTVMAIIVLVPVLLGRWKIPNVIGLILAGIIVGPYGFKLLARDMSFDVFGAVGLLYLMFLAGLEIDMHSLRQNMSRGLVFGLLTFVIPLGMGFAVGTSLLEMNAPCGLLLGSMFAAHTLIAYPVVSRFGISKAPVVVVTVAGTIVAVLCSLIVLAAVTSGLGAGAGNFAMFKLLLGLATFTLGVLYLYPRIARWFFQHYDDGILQFVGVMALVFLAASVAQWIGIEGVFGAFFAGLVLNRYIPSRSVLMRRLEFVGNALFIPYFLIGVGMIINIRVVFDGWDTVYVAAVMISVAMAAKWLAAYFTQKIFQYTSAQRSILYQLSNAHTAVALAVVMIGFGLNLFSTEVLNGTVVMILVTCCVSSLGAERAAMKIKLRMLSDNPLPDVSKNRREKIMVTVANPITVPSLVEMALLMRNHGKVPTELVAVHVRNESTHSAREIGRVALETAEKTALAAESEITTIERFDLNVTTGVLNAAVERDVSAIIIGLHRKGSIVDTFFGDKIEQLVRGTSRMVAVTRCFIPVSTITRLVIAVPPKAEHETGFRLWVEGLGNLAREVGCRAIFCCHPLTARFIRAVLNKARISIRAEYNTLKTYDDFTFLPATVIDDDLFVVVSARRASVSYNDYIDNLPGFLEKYFERNNLMIIYPSQKGSEQPITLAGTMASGLYESPSSLWLAVRGRYRLIRRGMRQLWKRK